MKNIKIMLLCALCIGVLASCKKKDPCPDLGSYAGAYLEIRIKDKTTGENLIGINKRYHPDSVKINELLGNSLSSFATSYSVISPRNNPQDYYVYAFLQSTSKFIIKYNTIDKDTLNVSMNGQLKCDLQMLSKIYLREQLIFQTFGDKRLNDALFLDIRK